MVRYQQWQKFSGCKCKCIILSALNLASTASSSAMWKAASYNSKGNRKVSWTLVSELLPEVAHSTHYICSQLMCKQSNWSTVTSRRASLVAPPVKNPPAMQERPWFNPWVWKIPWRRQLTPAFLAGEFHGWRSLVGYSPWNHKRVRHNLATKQQQQQLQDEDGCRRYRCTQRRKWSMDFIAAFLMFKQDFLQDFSKPEGWMYSVQAVYFDFSNYVFDLTNVLPLQMTQRKCRTTSSETLPWSVGAWGLNGAPSLKHLEHSCQAWRDGHRWWYEHYIALSKRRLVQGMWTTAGITGSRVFLLFSAD